MRETYKLMNNWLFTDLDGKQSTLDLPHTWNAKDGQDGGDDYRRGTCTYENTLPKPTYNPDTQRVFLQFHGVNASAVVFVNGTKVMEHDGGYSTFRADVTDVLQEDNHILVHADNSKNNRVYPQMADFTFYGGIYRDVEWLVVNKEHFDLEYYGGDGLKVTQTIHGADAELYVQTWLNDHKTICPKDCLVKVSVTDADGVVVAEDITACNEEGYATEVIVRITKAHFWNGKKDPYLYRVTARLIKTVDGQEEVLDEISHSLGVRWFRFDPEKGFFLNGNPYPLHGVSRHQDWKGIGNAITKEHMDTDMELIKEIGANTIRLAHYQHDQYFYDLCDREGMIVWAEIPYISAHMTEGNDNAFSQMRELIVQNHHHACIVTWGISNEITIKDNHRKHMLQNHRNLQEFVKKLDRTRKTTLACYAVCGPFHPVTKITDIVAWNLYLGWYVPFLWLNDLWIGFYHFVYPDRCLGYSEYGAEGMPNLHSERPKRGDNTEEYQNIYHEYMLRCFKRHPYMWGTYVWNMFDFAADARNQGGEPGMNHKGLVTFDRKLKKDCFYLYKAYWNEEEPFVYLAGRRFTYRKSYKQVITVYSNQKEVALYHNGNLVETKQGEHVFKFKVTLADGENHIEVKAGGLTDGTVINRTNEVHPEYVVQKVDTKNWM